jgi:hypothetical protein
MPTFGVRGFHTLYLICTSIRTASAPCSSNGSGKGNRSSWPPNYSDQKTPRWHQSTHICGHSARSRPGKFLRRFVFWRILYLSGAKRAKKFGTFMASSLGKYGVEQHHPLTPLTTYLTFGPVSPTGAVTVKIIYDHRVLDGAQVARALRDVETVLNTVILEEVRLFPQGGG